MQKGFEIRAGSFLIAGVGIFIAVVLLLGQERQIFTRQTEFYTQFKDVKGLSEGAPVRLGGISIGRVSDIGYSDDWRDPLIQVRLLINRSYLDRIRTDSKVSLQTAGLLGDQYISISPGTQENLIQPGAKIKSIEAANLSDVLHKAGLVVDNTVEISDNVNHFVKELRSDALNGFSETFNNLSDISKAIRKGKGFLSKLVYSEKDGSDILKNIESASSDIKSITEQMKSGDSLFNALLYDKKGKETISSLINASENLAITADHISNIAREIKEGDGLLHQLVFEESPQGIDDIIKKLHKTADNLEKASNALAQGNGTLGALLVDSDLYDNLVEVTDGAKRSFILRQAIRSTLNKSTEK